MYAERYPISGLTRIRAGTDKIATYGLAALVAGGVLAKTGLLKGLLVGILAFKKVIVVGVVAAIAFVKKLFAKRPPTA